MALQAKRFDKAVAIMGRNQWWDKLNQVVGQLQGQDPAEQTALGMCAAFFRRAGQTQFAKEAYVKLQDYQVSSLPGNSTLCPGFYAKQDPAAVSHATAQASVEQLQDKCAHPYQCSSSRLL